MTAYSDFKKYEAVLAHCQSSANSELYRNAEDYGKAAGFFDSHTARECRESRALYPRSG